MNNKSGFELIPTGAKVLATIAYGLVMVGVCLMSSIAAWKNNGAGLGIEIIIGIAAGAFAAGYVLLAGYVYGDAARRGMPPIPWTLLVVLVPNLLGFVLYFLLRKAILHPCPHCGFGSPEDALFCARCGQTQMQAAQ